MSTERVLCTGTGLKIPPAAQQALQMTGSIPFGNMAAPGQCDGSFLSSVELWL